MQHPEGPTRGTDRHLYTPVHSSATQHRPKWNPTPTDGWTDEQCGPSIQQNTIQPREENSNMLQHEPRRHYAKWRKPGTKGQYCKIPLIGGPQSDQIQRQKTTLVARGWRRGMGSLVFRRCSSTWEDGKALQQRVAMAAQQCVRTRCHSTVQSKRQKGQTVNTWREATGREKGLLSQALPTCQVTLHGPGQGIHRPCTSQSHTCTTTLHLWSK